MYICFNSFRHTILKKGEHIQHGSALAPQPAFGTFHAEVEHQRCRRCDDQSSLVHGTELRYSAALLRVIVGGKVHTEKASSDSGERSYYSYTFPSWQHLIRISGPSTRLMRPISSQTRHLLGRILGGIFSAQLTCWEAKALVQLSGC